MHSAKMKEVNDFQLETIVIKNPDKWKVAKLPDFLMDDVIMGGHKTTIKNLKTTTSIEQSKSMSNAENKLIDIPDQEEEDVIIINETVKVKEYAPDSFAFLRNLDEIDQNVIIDSLSPEKNRDSVFKAGESQGKSGSFFFFSHDKNFIIKTMTDSDLYAFKNVFKDYFYNVSRHPDSLLARIYGIYSVEMEGMAAVHLILMGNTKKCDDKNIEYVYDLKGSFVNRHVPGNNLKNTATLKDLNLLSHCQEKVVSLC